jgi:hypothetical protein
MTPNVSPPGRIGKENIVRLPTACHADRANSGQRAFGFSSRAKVKWVLCRKASRQGPSPVTSCRSSSVAITPSVVDSVVRFELVFSTVIAAPSALRIDWLAAHSRPARSPSVSSMVASVASRTRRRFRSVTSRLLRWHICEYFCGQYPGQKHQRLRLCGRCGGSGGVTPS